MVNITDVKTCSLKISPLSDDCHTFFFNSHTTCHDRMEKVLRYAVSFGWRVYQGKDKQTA